jgi:hypothetical protein
MPIFIVSFRGVALTLLVLCCLGAIPKTTVFVLFMVAIVKSALWLMRMPIRIENWRWRRDLY